MHRPNCRRPHAILPLSLACLVALALAAPVAFGQSFGPAHLVDMVPGDRPVATFAAYIDGDEHLDFVCAFFDSGSIAWYRNNGQPSPQFTRFTIDSSLLEASDVAAADMNGDGNMDIVAIGLDGILRWYENDGGATPAFTSRTISSTLAQPLSLVAVDLDGDDDVDIAISLGSAAHLRWFENLGGPAPTFTARTILTGNEPLMRMKSGDLDGDGDVDLVAYSNWLEALFVFRNDGQSPPSFVLDVNLLPHSGSNDLFITDIDLDGDNDIASISASTGSVIWFDNDPEFPTGFRPRTIANVGGPGRSVFAADLDGDGDVDIAGGWAGGQQAIWFENNGQSPPGFTRHDVVTPVFLEVERLFVSDLNRDGDPDILAVGSDEVRWLESNLLGTVALPEEAIRNVNAGLVYPAPHMLAEAIDDASPNDVLLVRGDVFGFPSDINLGDNSPLTLVASGNIAPVPPHLSYFLRNDTLKAVAADVVGFPRFIQVGAVSVPIGREILVHEPGSIALGSLVSLQQSSLLEAATTIDVITGGSLVIGPAANARIVAPGGTRVAGQFALPNSAFLDVTGPFVLGSTPSFEAHTVSEAVSFATSIAGADINGDGHMDIITSSQGDNTVYWHEHDGNDPPAFTIRVVSSLVGGARSVVPVDLDGDGDMDIVAVAEFDDAIRWYRNDGSSPPSFEARTVFVLPGSGPQHVVAFDFDADGDMDVLSACAVDGTIRWHENDGGDPPAFTARTVFAGAPGASSVFAADMDGDGDLDVLSTSANDNTVRWYRRGAGNPPMFTEHVLSSTAMGASSVHAADFNSDGRKDVIAASPLDNSIRWFRNLGGNPPTFAESFLPAPGLGPVWVLAADIEGDGDPDYFYASSADGAIRWVQNDGHSDPTFFPYDVYTPAPAASCVALADVDGDGHRDVLSTSLLGGSVLWHKSTPDVSSVFNPGSLLSVSARATLARPVSLNNGVIVARGELTNSSQLAGSGTLAADTTNDAHITLLASLVVIGDYTNNHTTFIQSGTLSVLGTLTNNGVLIGDFGRSVAGGMSVQNDYHAGAAATLAFPLGGTVSCGGDFSAAIDRHDRFHLAAATLKLNGLSSGGPQSLEVMSKDIGPDPDGLDRSLSGHFPIGTLRIGPTATTVDLVDAHDNARDGQASCEAVYTSSLVIDAGATLNTGSCRIYYQALTLNGTVDTPANLIQITPPCPADYNGDGTRDVPDIFAFLTDWFAAVPAAYTFGGTPGVPAIFAFLTAWFAGCP